MRDVCGDAIRGLDGVKIGGPGKTVEVDESKRKRPMLVVAECLMCLAVRPFTCGHTTCSVFGFGKKIETKQNNLSVF